MKVRILVLSPLLVGRMVRVKVAAGVALGLLIGVGAMQAQVARPPANVTVPTFTPVAPGSRATPDTQSDPPPAFGALTPSDCKDELDGIVQTGLERLRMERRRTDASTPDLIRKGYVEAYLSPDGNGQPMRMAGGGHLTGTQFARNMQFYAQQANGTVPACTDLDSCNRASTLRSAKFDKCVWDTALARGKVTNTSGATRVNAPPPPPPALPPDCADQNLAAANEETIKIDAALASYNKQVPANSTAITPALQAVMWGTSKQAEVIKKYCPNSPSFKARLGELNAAYDAALNACRQINSSPDAECVPALPDSAAFEAKLAEIPVPDAITPSGNTSSRAKAARSTTGAKGGTTSAAGRQGTAVAQTNTSPSQTKAPEKQKQHGPQNASSCIVEKSARLVNTCDYDVEVSFCVENPQQTKNFFDNSKAFECPNGGLSTVRAGGSEPNVLHGDLQWFACSEVDIATMRTRYRKGSGYEGSCY